METTVYRGLNAVYAFALGVWAFWVVGTSGVRFQRFGFFVSLM